MKEAELVARSESPRDQSWKNKGRFRSLFSFCAFHFLDDGFTDSIYILLPFIAAEFHLSFSQVGLLKGVFSGMMSLLQFPMSLLGEKVGESWVIVGGSLGLAGGFLLLSMAYTFSAIFLSLILAKGTNAGQHGLGSSILSKTFEGPGRRTVMGTYNFSGDLGKVCLPFLVALMIPLWGWRQAIFILALGGILLAIVLTLFFRPRRIAPAPAKAVASPTASGSPWGIRNRKTFTALLAIGVIDIMVRNVLLTFLPFLLLEKGRAALQVGFALTLLFVGGALGQFFCGLLAEVLGVIPMVIGTEALTAAGILSLFYSSPAAIWLILPMVGIALNGTSSVLYATVAEVISPSGRSRGYGLYYAITLGSGAVSPMLYGFLTDSLGLSFTMVSIALVVLLTLPLSRFLAPSNESP